MERVIQYLDDLEDIVYAVALTWERVRSIFRFAVFLLASLTVQVSGVFLALSNPPLAGAMATLLGVALLYRSAVYHGPSAIPAT